VVGENASMTEAPHGTMTMTSAPPEANVLESLPPIIPSIGFARRPIGGVVGAVTDGIDPSTTVVPSNGDIDPLAFHNNILDVTAPDVVRVGNRLILTSKPARSWAWKSFSSSARHDATEFNHWVRSNVEYADYPYARFDVSLDPLIYTDEEYAKYLDNPKEMFDWKLEMKEWDLVTGERRKMVMDVETKEGGVDDGKDLPPLNDKAFSWSSSTSELQHLLSTNNRNFPWTKSETDALLELARACDLRWSVIIDRWHTRFVDAPVSKLRKIEDLQHRYYEVGDVLLRCRAQEIVAREAAKLEVVVGGGGITTAADPPPKAKEGKVDAVPAASTGGNTDGLPSFDQVVESVVAPGTTSINNDTPAPSNSDSATITNATTQQLPESLEPSTIPPTEIEALKQLHHQITMDHTLVPPLSHPETGTIHHRGGTKVFDLTIERARRAQLDRLWHRTKEEEREEEELRAELRIVEAQLRKLKRAGKHVVPASSVVPPDGSSLLSGGTGVHADVKRGASSGATIPPTQSQFREVPPPAPRLPLDVFMQTHHSVSASFVETAPVPTPGTPYLQSGRLFPPAIEGHTGLNQNTLKQMNAILHELNVPKDPIPTKRNCDLYDGVRKDALTLLILQKIVLRKEGELNAKREKLLEIQSTAAAAVVAREEAEKKNLEDEEKKKTSKEEGGAKTSSEAPAKSKTSKRPRDESTMLNQDIDGVAKGKEGGDEIKPKKRYQKKKKVDTASTAVGALTAAGGTKLDVSNSASTPVEPPVGMMPPPPQVPTVANPTVSPMVISKKKLAVTKPTPVEKADDEKDSTLAPVIPVASAAAVKGKRGRKPKKKDD